MFLNKFILITFVSLLLGACKFYHFDNIAGVSLPEFPIELRGNYFYIQKHNGIKDTVKITINSNSITSQNDNYLKTITLSDSIILTKIQSQYFINILNKDSSNSNIWQVFPFKNSKSNLYLHFLTQNKKNKKILKYLETKNNSAILKMDTLKLKQFCDKKLKKRKAIKFKKYE